MNTSRRKGGRRSRAPRGRQLLRVAERLESRQLLSISPGMAASAGQGDDASQEGCCPLCGSGGCCSHTTDTGLTYVACGFPDVATIAAQDTAVAAVAVAPLADTFALHSRPTATKKIYLDFDGHVTSGTAWGETINTPAYSLDGDFATFSDAEKTVIQAIWTRVAEDFIPFDVDVTTEAPPVEDLRNTGAGDTRWGMRVVVGGDGAWMPGAAGVAFLGSFSWNSDTPCFAFAGQGWKANAEFAATCISHEVGHTLGLAHDGYNGSEYYGGRGTGANSWGPLMGNPSRPLTQWSNGDYGGSTNKQDDLTVMTGFGFGFRPDDHGDTVGTATIAGSGNISVAGIIGRRTDVDVIGFDAPSGDLVVSVKPLAAGANLDVLAKLLDANGNVLATSNPATAIDASFRRTVMAGRFYVSVDGTGYGDPNTTGYSDYGSLGQYTVTVGQPTGPLPTLSVADVAVVEGDSGTTQATLTFTLSSAAAATATVDYATANGSATTADNDYVAATGTVTFAPGDTQKTVLLTVRGDLRVEASETFIVNLSSVVGATLARSSATVTITNDDGGEPPPPPPPAPVPQLSVQDVVVAEGNAGATQATLTFVLSAAPTSPVTVRYATANGTATAADKDFLAAAGTVSFAAGETRKTVVLTVYGDTKAELDESFTVLFSNAVGATLTRPSATVTITNDDAAPELPTVTISGPDSVVEGNSGTRTVAFDIVLSRGVTQVTAVNVALVAGTATAGRDYRGTARTRVVFSPMRQVVRVVVAIVGDRDIEPDETFSIVLSDPVGLRTGAVASKTVTITNDDTAIVAPRSQAAASRQFMSLPQDQSSATLAGASSPWRRWRAFRGR